MSVKFERFSVFRIYIACEVRRRKFDKLRTASAPHASDEFWFDPSITVRLAGVIASIFLLPKTFLLSDSNTEVKHAKTIKSSMFIGYIGSVGFWSLDCVCN